MRKTFDAELQELNYEMIDMAAAAEDAIDVVTESLASGDDAAAKSAVEMTRSMDQMEQEAEAFLKEMRTAFLAAEQTVSLSASVGIAQSSDSMVDIDALLQRSDQALYQAKKAGRSRYCVYR